MYLHSLHSRHGKTGFEFGAVHIPLPSSKSMIARLCRLTDRSQEFGFCKFCNVILNEDREGAKMQRLRNFGKSWMTSFLKSTSQLCTYMDLWKPIKCGCMWMRFPIWTALQKYSQNFAEMYFGLCLRSVPRTPFAFGAFRSGWTSSIGRPRGASLSAISCSLLPTTSVKRLAIDRCGCLC